VEVEMKEELKLSSGPLAGGEACCLMEVFRFLGVRSGEDRSCGRDCSSVGDDDGR
jgi:hypothetical protein